MRQNPNVSQISCLIVSYADKVFLFTCVFLTFKTIYLLRARYTRASDGSLLEMGFPIIYFMDETWINKNHKKGFTWKRAIQMAGYRDSDGKVNYLPTFYEGDMDLGTGKGKRMILMHFSKFSILFICCDLCLKI